MGDDSKVLAPAEPVRRRPPNAGKGRKKGVPNKFTGKVKEALELAFEQSGGVPALVKWAKTNREEFYKIWVRAMPQQVNVAGQLTLEQLVNGSQKPPA